MSTGGAAPASGSGGGGTGEQPGRVRPATASGCAQHRAAQATRMSG
jgi:hypothetical protein